MGHAFTPLKSGQLPGFESDQVFGIFGQGLPYGIIYRIGFRLGSYGGFHAQRLVQATSL